MSVLIKGMEKPEHCGYCRFRYDGICHALQKTQYSMNECPLVVIDDAGLNDTISRQAAIDAIELLIKDLRKDAVDVINFGHNYNHGVADAIATLKHLPSAERRGRWIGYNTDKEGWKRTDGSPVFMSCSECHGTVLNNGSAHWNYCPNCGTKMDEVSEDE